MKNLETPAVKLAVYGAQSSTGNALMVEALARQFETTLILDDLNAVSARPGLSTIQGDLYDAISVSHSIAGKDAVIVVLPASDHDHQFESTFKAVTALLDGLPVAGVKRLLLVGDFTWLDGGDDGMTEPLGHLKDRLTASPVVWTLFDAPAAEVQGDALTSFTAQVIDEVCHAEHMHQRIRIHAQPTAAPNPVDVDVMPQP